MLRLIITFGAWTIVVFCFGAAFGSIDSGTEFSSWLVSYDGLVTAAVAAFGIAVAVWQIEAGRKQHQATVRLTLKDEFEAVRSASRYAEVMLRQCTDTRGDIVAALSNAAPQRTFWLPDDATLRAIKKFAGEHVSIFADILVNRIRYFIEWQDAGSPDEVDFIGGEPIKFDARVDQIMASCITLAEVCRIRAVELEKYVTG